MNEVINGKKHGNSKSKIVHALLKEGKYLYKNSIALELVKVRENFSTFKIAFDEFHIIFNITPENKYSTSFRNVNKIKFENKEELDKRSDHIHNMIRYNLVMDTNMKTEWNIDDIVTFISYLMFDDLKKEERFNKRYSKQKRNTVKKVVENIVEPVKTDDIIENKENELIVDIGNCNFIFEENDVKRININFNNPILKRIEVVNDKNKIDYLFKLKNGNFILNKEYPSCEIKRLRGVVNDIDYNYFVRELDSFLVDKKKHTISYVKMMLKYFISLLEKYTMEMIKDIVYDINIDNSVSDEAEYKIFILDDDKEIDEWNKDKYYSILKTESSTIINFKHSSIENYIVVDKAVNGLKFDFYKNSILIQSLSVDKNSLVRITVKPQYI